MTGAQRHRQVLRVDLRDASAAAAVGLIDTELGRVLRSNGHGQVEVAGFVVVDREDGLVHHQVAYEKILTGGVGARLVCVAIADGEAAQPAALDRPALLRPPLAGTIWVRDLCGTGPAAGPAAREAAQAALTDVLCAPAVFDRVLDAVGQMPDAVAGLSLRVLLYDLADGAVRQARAEALRRFAGSGDEIEPGEPRAPRLPASLAVLLGERPVPPANPDEWLRPDGGLDMTRRTAVDRMYEALDLRDDVRKARGLLTGAAADLPAAAADAAAALASYRAEAVSLLADPLVDGGEPEQRRDRLDAFGARTPAVPELARRRLETETQAYTLSLLDQRQSLRGAASILRDLAVRGAPSGSAGRVTELDSACAVDLLDRLRAEPTVRTGDLGPAPLTRAIGTGLAALLAGLAGASLPALAAAAGVLAVLLALTGRRLVAARLPGRGDAVTGADTGAQLAAGLAGAAAAFGIVRAVGPLGPVWLAAVVGPVAVAVLAWSVVRAWTAAVNSWVDAVGLDEIGAAVTGIDDVLGAAAAQDWPRADARAVVDGMYGVSGYLGSLAAVADQRAELVGPPPTPRLPGTAPIGGRRSAATGGRPTEHGGEVTWLDRRAGRVGPALVDALVEDLCAAAVELLDPCWLALRVDPDEISQLSAEDPASARFGELERLWEQYGVSRRPRWSSDADRPDRPVELSGVSPGRVADALDRPDLVPLCDPAQYRLFGHGVSDQWAIRFAPAFARSAIGLADRPTGWDAEDVEWVHSGRYVGVLRLHPLLRGTVRTVQYRADDDVPDRLDRGQW